MNIDSPTPTSLPGSLTRPDLQSGPTRAAGTPKDEFLRLLVAQLKHQNPLDPQDGAEFVAQLAQFASLEQAAETNRRLGNLESGQDAASRAALVSLTGRPVSARADTLQYDPARGALPQLGVRLERAAQTVEVVIRDGHGSPVRTIQLGATSAGHTALSWDGLDGAGQPLAAGTYTIEVRARDAAGEAVSAGATLRGSITAIDFGGAQTDFQVGAATIRPGDILSLDG